MLVLIQRQQLGKAQMREKLYVRKKKKEKREKERRPSVKRERKKKNYEKYM